jgi:serine/threonine protein kinase
VKLFAMETTVSAPAEGLHRDIKPANILINRYGVVGLSDFGLASILAAEREQSVTREALTPAYAPPESFRGNEPSAAGDLYSLAAQTFYLYEDGYGYPQVATGYVATVTLTSGDKTLTKTVPVLANT